MSGQAAATAVKAATSAAAKNVTSADGKAKAAGALNRYLVTPVMNTLNKIESSSVRKSAAVEPATAEWISTHSANGADAASVATKQYLHLQRQLVSYRVVRLFQEGRYVASGQYFKAYTWGRAVDDARFLTQLFFIFLCAVMIGRRGVFSPIAPDSPFAIALDDKVNPNY